MVFRLDALAGGVTGFTSAVAVLASLFEALAGVASVLAGVADFTGVAVEAVEVEAASSVTNASPVKKMVD